MALKSRPAFTIIELLIVAAAFAVIFLVVTTVYANAFRSHRKVESSQRVAADARYIFETMSRSIRTGIIPYPADIGGVDRSLPASDNKLVLQDSQGGYVCYKYESANKAIYLYTTSDCTGTFSNITPVDISVEALQFSVFPKTNPFENEPNDPNTQPHVTISMQTKNVTRGETEREDFQTTVVTRTYLR